MDNKKFILGLLAYEQPSSQTDKKEILKRVRQQLPSSIRCWYGDIFSYGQGFWGMEIKDKSCAVVYFSGLMDRNDNEVRFHHHEFLKVPPRFITPESDGPFGVVIETETGFSYKKNNEVDLTAQKETAELYLFSYVLRNECGINADFVPALKKVADKLIKHFDVLEVSSAWGKNIIRISMVKKTSKQEDFLRWVQDMKEKYGFNPDTDSDIIACGRFPIQLTWVRNVSPLN